MGKRTHRFAHLVVIVNNNNSEIQEIETLFYHRLKYPWECHIN